MRCDRAPAEAAVPLDGMKTVVEGVVDFPLDQTTADPEATGPVPE